MTDILYIHILSVTGNSFTIVFDHMCEGRVRVGRTTNLFLSLRYILKLIVFLLIHNFNFANNFLLNLRLFDNINLGFINA